MPNPPRLSDLSTPKGTDAGTLRSRGRRFTELLSIARRHGLVPFRRLDFSHDPATSDVRRRQAEHLRRALEEAGGGFVKMGQLLSTRDDLLPEEWTEGLAHLQRSVTPAPADEVAALLERELGAPVDEVFAAFDPVPVAAASIAQVHRARLADGASVAVKVQRPGIDAAVRRDVDIALRVVRFMARWSVEARQVGVQDVAAQYAEDLIRQVDFGSELRNLTALRAAQARSARPDEVRFPEPYPDLSGRRVLVMEFLEGDTLSAIRAARADRDLDEPMRAILRAFLRQVVFDGVYHADLHPGTSSCCRTADRRSSTSARSDGSTRACARPCRSSSPRTCRTTPHGSRTPCSGWRRSATPRTSRTSVGTSPGSWRTSSAPAPGSAWRPWTTPSRSSDGTG
ncbi:AarF/UbiB family protein [Curtobacterium flaccumfaciens]|nr:AarF/UbiB family protein [Curtobacterium flaccumfaciens]